MRNAISNSILGRTAAAGALLLGAAFAGQAAMACTLGNWSTSSGAVAAGDPTVTGGSIARYSGFCGMGTLTSVQGYVQDNNPGGIDRIVARFYYWANNSTPGQIYAGYGDTAGSSERFMVSVDSSGVFTLTDTATGESVSQAGNDGRWNSVEIDWAQGTGTGVISLSVNDQTAAENASLTNVGTQLQSVRLGNLNAYDGVTYFDAYESRRSTAVGRLVCSDANNDSNITGGDLSVIAGEILGNALASGQPDCNEDGSITGADLSCTASIILGTNPNACPGG